jgi:hypothetical protein
VTCGDVGSTVVCLKERRCCFNAVAILFRLLSPSLKMMYRSYILLRCCDDAVALFVYNTVAD